MAAPLAGGPGLARGSSGKRPFGELARAWAGLDAAFDGQTRNQPRMAICEAIARPSAF